MEYRYIPIQCQLDARFCYGVAAVTDYDDCVVVLESYVDLYAEQDAVIRFVDLCNAQKLSLIHLHDAIEDFLANL